MIFFLKRNTHEWTVKKRGDKVVIIVFVFVVAVLLLDFFRFDRVKKRFYRYTKNRNTYNREFDLGNSREFDLIQNDNFEVDMTESFQESKKRFSYAKLIFILNFIAFVLFSGLFFRVLDEDMGSMCIGVVFLLTLFAFFVYSAFSDIVREFLFVLQSKAKEKKIIEDESISAETKISMIKRIRNQPSYWME